ncbi:hypothetical protein ScPMuIL_015997 [Solemya velum]
MCLYTHSPRYFTATSALPVCPVDMETTYDGSSPALTIADSSPSSSNSQPEDALRPSGGNNWEPSTPLPEPYLTVTIPSDGNHPLMEITVTVIKVSKINVRIPGKDSKGIVVEQNGPVTITFEEGWIVNSGTPIKITFEPIVDQTPGVSDLSVKVCGQSVSSSPVSTSLIAPTTLFTTTPSVVTTTPSNVCPFDMARFIEESGATPPFNFRIEGSSSDEGTFNPETDMVEEGVILYVDCSYCTCDEDGLDCTYINCVTTTPSGQWSTWGECEFPEDPCAPGIRTRVKICGPSMEPCPEGRQTEFCPPPENCATTTPMCQDPMLPVECLPCQRTCYHVRYPDMTCEEPESCMAGCVCPEDYVMHDGVCIEEDDCPCIENGEVLPIGQTIPGETTCEECVCTEENEMDCYIIPGCCDFGEWGNWTECTADCDGGVQTRSRSMVSGSEDDCEDDANEERQCNVEECPKPCEFRGVDYSEDELVPNYSSDICEECFCKKNMDEEFDIECEPNPDAERDGEWSDWSEWGSCSRTCNGGNITRYRDCNNPSPRCGGSPCEEECYDTQPCNEDIPCCELTQWTPWTDCSEMCGPGTKSRNRTQVDPSESCDDELNQEINCNYGNCTDCEDLEWGEWSACWSDDGCGIGTKTKTMIVPDECEDTEPSTESADCYIGDCVCPEGMIWSNFSLCNTCEDIDADPSDCEEMVPGCVCPEGYLYDSRDDTCKLRDECYACIVNGTVYENMENFEHPYHECLECHCNRGEWEESCVEKACSSAPCPPGTVSRTLEGECCPTCVPIEDTCREFPKYDYLRDAHGHCTSKEKQRFSVCAGSCGNSRTDIFLLDPYSSTTDSTATSCTCCTAILKTDVRVNIEVECNENGNIVERTAIYIPIERCQCNICAGEPEPDY